MRSSDADGGLLNRNPEGKRFYGTLHEEARVTGFGRLGSADLDLSSVTDKLGCSSAGQQVLLSDSRCQGHWIVAKLCSSHVGRRGCKPATQEGNVHSS